MLASLRNMFKVPDLRNKVLFTLLIIGVYLLGANIVVPGVNFAEIQTISTAEKSGGVLGFLNLFSGGALARAAIFGLGIMPYITSSIIVQLLQTVIPKFEQWREQGAVGQRKLTQATRYLTVALAVMQSSGLVFLFHSGELFGSGSNIDLIPDFTAPRVLFIILVFTAGTAVVMWLAELITQRGIGNGMSILIFSNVVAALPIYGEQVKADKGWFGLGRDRLRRARCSSSPSSLSSRASGASRSHSRNGSRDGACTAARAPTSPSRSTRPALSRSSSRARCCTSPSCCRTSCPGRRCATGCSTTC